jgi:hypothetical protein
LNVVYNPNAVFRIHYTNSVFSPTSYSGVSRFTVTPDPGYTLPSMTVFIRALPFIILNGDSGVTKYVGLLTETPVITNSGLTSSTSVTVTTNVNLNLAVATNPRENVLGMAPYTVGMPLISIQVRTTVRNIRFQFEKQVVLNNLVIRTTTSPNTEIQFIFAVIYFAKAGNPTFSLTNF